MPRDIPNGKTHDFWIARLARAHRRLNRTKKASQWSKWAKLADIEDYNKPSFTEPARRDIRLDIIGERPIVRIETCRAADRHKEVPLTHLCEYELDNDSNWSAIGRVVEDAGLSGIGWLRSNWWMDGDVGPSKSQSEEEEQVQQHLAHQHIAALLAGQKVTVEASADHALHVAMEGAVISSQFGLSSMQRLALEAHIKEHDAYISPLPPAGFRLTRIHPANMLFDDTADEWENVEWIAERVVRRIEDVKEDALLKNTANLKGSPEVKRRGYRHTGRRGDIYTRPPADTVHRSESLLDGEDLYAVLWYVHDRVHDEMVVVAEGHPDRKELLRGPWPYEDVTYFPLVFDRETDGIEGISDYNKIIHPCEQRAVIQARWLEHLNVHSRRKILHQPGFLDAKGESQLKDPNAVLVEVKNISLHQALPDLPINRDAYTVDDRMRENVNRGLGIGEAQQGVGGTTNSATEASQVDASRGRVVRDRRKKVAAMITWVIRRVLNYYKNFGTDKMFLQRGVGPEQDIVLDPDDITEAVKVVIDNDSLSATNAEMDRQLVRQAVEVLNASPWMLGALGTNGRLEIIKKFLRSQKLLSNPDTILAEGAVEAVLTGQMMPPEQLAARKAAGPTAAGTPGQQTGNMQTAVQSGATTAGAQQPQAPAGGGAGY